MSPNDSLVPCSEPRAPCEADGLSAPSGGAGGVPAPEAQHEDSPVAAEGTPQPARASGSATEPAAGLSGLAAFGRGRVGRPRAGKRLVQPREASAPLTAEQRLLLLDTWQRSGLSPGDFAALVGMSRHTLYAWKKKFDAEGPGGLVDRPRGGPAGSRLPELTRAPSC